MIVNFDDAWPYLASILVGFIPNEFWRIFGVVLSRGLNENSEIIIWAKAVATAILAIIIVRLVLVPSGGMSVVPLFVRTVGMAVGLIIFFAFRRSVLAAILAGEIVFVLGAWLADHRLILFG